LHRSGDCCWQLNNLLASDTQGIECEKRRLPTVSLRADTAGELAQAVSDQLVADGLDVLVVHRTVSKHLRNRRARNHIVELVQQRQLPKLVEFGTGIHSAAQCRQRRVQELNVVQQAFGTAVAKFVASLSRVGSAMVFEILLASAIKLVHIALQPTNHTATRNSTYQLTRPHTELVAILGTRLEECIRILELDRWQATGSAFQATQHLEHRFTIDQSKLGQ
jgi:hypothetical protein